MLKQQLKNHLKTAIAASSVLLPQKNCSKKDTPTIYCNLLSSTLSGGPTRFLRNLTQHPAVHGKVHFNAWSLRHCQAALFVSASSGQAMLDLCRRQGVKTVLRLDGFYLDAEKDSAFGHGSDFKRQLNQQMRADIAAVDHVVYQSQFAKQMIDQHLITRDCDYSLIYNGVCTEHFCPAANQQRTAELGSASRPLRLLMLGKHYPEHLQLAFSVLQQLQSKLEVTLTIIGPMRNNSSVTDYLVAANLSSKQREAITVVGELGYAQLPQQLQHADIFLHTKLNDWCPNAVLEAMSCGLPVICLAAGGTKELVGDGGVIVGHDKQDNTPMAALANEMAEAALTIASKPGVFATTARNRILTRFDMSQSVYNYLKVLDA